MQFGMMTPVEPTPRERTPWASALHIGWRAWSIGIGAAVVSAAAIAVPTRLVSNPWFTRMTPTRPQDYAFLVLSAVLLGATIAVTGRARGILGRGPVAGGLGTFVAVGCPVCNKAVVMLLGVGGATTWFAPLQPVIAVIALVVLFAAFRAGVRSLATGSCPAPT